MADKPDKTKMSLFLDPEVAKAAKVQAARADVPGVSELMRTVILCTHCREPITGEFIVGPPTLIAHNKWGVFFHQDRDECRAAASRSKAVSFLMKCPECGNLAHQEFDREKLTDRVRNNKVRLYCIQCDNHWNATPEDTAAVARYLGV